MRKFIAVLWMCTVSAVWGTDTILLWQVDDAALVDGINIVTFLDDYPDTWDSWPAARVLVSGASFADPVVLDVYVPPYDGYPGGWESGENGVWLGDVGGGYWGTGSYTQSLVPEGATVEGAIFAVELGYNYDGVWQTIAVSDPRTFSELNRHIYETFDLNPLTSDSWTPTIFHTVPEPEIFLLVLFGLSPVLFNRKKLDRKLGTR